MQMQPRQQGDREVSGMKIPANKTVRALNTLLRGELAAVAGYKRALSDPKTKAEYRLAFEECLSSHGRRVLRLQSEVARRGGIPVFTMARTWRFLLTCFAWTSQVAGMAVLRPLLRLIEMLGLRRYDRVWSHLDARAQRLVSWELFPQQVLTRQSMLLARIAWKGASDG
jgi:hypothetical protein